MKEIDAIEELKYCAKQVSGELNIACEMAISALEKQIPKKFVCEGNDENDWVYCPCCDEILGTNESVYNAFSDNDYEYIYCYKCGQSLNWK